MSILKKRNYHDEILKRENFKCFLCNKIFFLEVHHIIFKSLGGKDNYRNLICLCSDCHRKAHLSNNFKYRFLTYTLFFDLPDYWDDVEEYHSKMRIKRNEKKKELNKIRYKKQKEYFEKNFKKTHGIALKEYQKTQRKVIYNKQKKYFNAKKKKF